MESIWMPFEFVYFHSPIGIGTKHGYNTPELIALQHAISSRIGYYQDTSSRVRRCNLGTKLSDLGKQTGNRSLNHGRN